MRALAVVLALAATSAPALALVEPLTSCAPADPLAPPSALAECGPLNAGFESCAGCVAGALPDDWEPYWHPSGCGASRVAWSTEDARSGAASLRVDDVAGACMGAVTPPIAIVPGVAYRASFWLRGDATASATVLVAFYVSADDGLHEYVTKTPSREAATASWNEVAVTAFASPLATHARVWVYADMASSGTFFVDDAALLLVPA